LALCSEGEEDDNSSKRNSRNYHSSNIDRNSPSKLHRPNCPFVLPGDIGTPDGCTPPPASPPPRPTDYLQRASTTPPPATVSAVTGSQTMTETRAFESSLAMRALQFLPVPLLVLSSQKHIVLASEAMGDLLGYVGHVTHERGVSCNSESRRACSQRRDMTSTFRGKYLTDLGIELFGEDRSLRTTSWDTLLDSIINDERSGFEATHSGDVKVAVHVQHVGEAPNGRCKLEGPARIAEMVISPWNGEDNKRYVSVTFGCVSQWEPLESLKDIGDLIAGGKSFSAESSFAHSAQLPNGKVRKILNIPKTWLE
jgi:hypothetical protein